MPTLRSTPTDRVSSHRSALFDRMSSLRDARGWFRRNRVKRWISRTFFQRPDAGAALWTIDAPLDRPHVDVLRLGACEFQEMNGAHTVTAPIGYPKHMAEELDLAGVGLGFQNIFVWNLEDFPSEHTLLKRRGRMQGRPPDVVLLQVGGWVAMKTILGFNHRIVGLRENLSRWMGPMVWPIHRVIVFFLRFFGRGMPEQGTRDLEQFVGLLHRRWPEARIVIMEPWRNGLKGAFDEARLSRVTETLRDTTRRVDCDWMPAPDFGPGRRLRCSNGFNLNEEGARFAGRHYATWLLEHGCVKPPTLPSGGDRSGGRPPGPPSSERPPPEQPPPAAGTPAGTQE